MKMMKTTIGGIALVSCLMAVGPSHAFVVGPTPASRTWTMSKSTSKLSSLQVPRIDLPTVITDKLEDFDLKNPNTMTTEEYQNYSGSAILGTLLFFAVPGALVTGLPGELVAILGAFATDFVVSAIVGGGAAIYLSLKDDALGASLRKIGSEVVFQGKELTGMEVTRYDIPPAATDAMTQKLGLLNPNELNDNDYDGYSGAAIAGTLAFFLLPGAFVTGAAGTAKEFLSTTVTDFLLSAIIGGGLFIYLSLRDDELSISVNKAGAKLLDTVDQLLEATSSSGKTEALPASATIPEPPQEPPTTTTSPTVPPTTTATTTTKSPEIAKDSTEEA